jgi:hypothetical protein
VGWKLSDNSGAENEDDWNNQAFTIVGSQTYAKRMSKAKPKCKISENN